VDSGTMPIEPDILLSVGDAIVAYVSPQADDAVIADRLCSVTRRVDIHITRRPSDRPSLAPPYAELGVSIAARGHFRVAAFAPSTRVGVDVEHIDLTLNATRLAFDHFASGEVLWVTAHPDGQRVEAFLRLWCAKEAVLKITGRGVFDGVHEPDLSDVAAGLRIDGAVQTIPAASDRGPCQVAVRRIDAHLIALAVER
jgi:4'-phosphopantetheinyl transferase